MAVKALPNSKVMELWHIGELFEDFC